MPARTGPRFALEAGFLVLLAVLAALADLSWQPIVAVMAVAWLLVAIHEVARWKGGSRFPERVCRDRPDRARLPIPATGSGEEDLLSALSVTRTEQVRQGAGETERSGR